MAKGNDGNLLQHAIEADLVVRLYRRGRGTGLHVVLTHGMEPYEAFEPRGKNPSAFKTLALTSTKVALGVSADRDWLKGYYQYANRIAALHFLTQHKVPAHLLLIYFLGDGFSGRTCPEDEAGWSHALDTQAKHLGLPRTHGLTARIHRLFLPVCPR
jgi:hypothetical protein